MDLDYIRQLESLVEDLSSKLAALESLEEWRSKRYGKRIYYHYAILYTHKFDTTIKKHYIARISATNIMRSYRETNDLHKALEVQNKLGSEMEGKYGFILEGARSIGLYVVPSLRLPCNVDDTHRRLEFIVNPDHPEMKLLCEWKAYGQSIH